MALVPEFWTCVVIAIDLESTTPPATVLSWSRNLALDFIITRVDFDRAVYAQHEQDQVASIMKTLVYPHVHRLRMLHFNVKFSSSLPPFPDSFQGTWSDLNQLFLECQKDNGVFADVWESISWTEGQKFPDPEGLLIDGRNYYNVCKKNSMWMTMCPVIWDVAVSRYTPLPGESFSLTDFMLPITTPFVLGSLRINDVSLLSPSPLPLTSEGGRVQLTDVLDLLPYDLDVVLTHCVMGHPNEPFNLGGRLFLRDIEADEDLVPLLRYWEGDFLKVDNCPGFNDAVLGIMAMAMAGSYCCAPRMVQLDSSNISAATLRRLVSVRSQDDGINTLCFWYCPKSLD